MAKKFDTSDFKRRLQKLPKVIRRELSDAMEKDAEEWVKTSRYLAPKDPEDGTPLHDSILRQATETGGQIVRAGGKTTTKPSKGGPYDYAVGREFGNSVAPAQPFYWPAYRLLRKKFTSRRRRALSKAIKEISNG